MDEPYFFCLSLQNYPFCEQISVKNRFSFKTQLLFGSEIWLSCLETTKEMNETIHNSFNNHVK